MTIHRLKTWAPYFEAVVSGAKPFEVRRNDRDFQVGDQLRLIEVDAGDGTPRLTGRETDAEVTYILSGGDFGIAASYVVLGLGTPRTEPS